MVLTDFITTSGFVYLALPLAGALCLGPLLCRFGTHTTMVATNGGYMVLCGMYAAIFMYRTQHAMTPNSIFRFPTVSAVDDLV